MKSVRIFLLFICFFAASMLKAQLTVNSTVTTNQLIQSLVSSGLSVSNVTLNCPVGSYASFSNGNATNLGINGGIILCTGLTDSIPFPNTTSFDMGVCVNAAGNPFNDPDLIAIDPLAQNDVCILEFDILPQCDSLTVRFVFGSDEYPVYVNSVNDVFGFFVSGPNPAGGQYTGLNIATIPPNIPVSINTINNGNTNTGPCVNCAYYVDNS
ncbi:MAG: choice-of-anchor L domain-containing protein, partial [Bacteroidia bacterium]